MDLNDISKKDKYWRSVAFNICKDKSLADDLVQEMYLSVYELDKKEINDFYIVTIINNSFLDHCRKNKRDVDINLIYSLGYESLQNDFDDEDINFLNRIDKLKWWEKELLKENYDKSIREIAKDFNINYAFIYRKLKEIREKVLQNDFDKLYNNKRFKR